MTWSGHHIHQRGFTLLEVLIIIGLVGLLAGLSIPFYQSFQVSSGLDNTTQELVAALRQSQSLAMGSKGWAAHGVHIESKRYILFTGSTYNSTDPTNQITSIASPITLASSAGTDIIFIRITGTTSNIGSITLTSNSNQANTITINTFGVINVH